ncbi:MAG: hypothetical protein HGA45_39950 [Chloroflexales bacterium]|nr:hypothetical protein [Chloroflexales bacterium]
MVAAAIAPAGKAGPAARRLCLPHPPRLSHDSRLCFLALVTAAMIATHLPPDTEVRRGGADLGGALRASLQGVKSCT